MSTTCRYQTVVNLSADVIETVRVKTHFSAIDLKLRFLDFVLFSTKFKGHISYYLGGPQFFKFLNTKNSRILFGKDLILV